MLFVSLVDGVSAGNKMNMIKYKRTNELSKTPEKANQKDAGFDIWAVDDGVLSYDEKGYIRYIEYGTGLHFEPSPYIHILIYPRSSIRNKDLILSNSVGVVDNGYRGELKVVFRPSKNVKDRSELSLYSKGERIAQLIPFRESSDFYFIESRELSDSQRGSGGFGSTGST